MEEAARVQSEVTCAGPLPSPQTAVSSEAAVAASAVPGRGTHYNLLNSVGNLEEGISPFSRLNNLHVEEEGSDLPSSC